MWKIDKDYINENNSRSGVSGESVNIGLPYNPEFVDLPEGPAVRFRMKDDDGNIYFGGWLNNDKEGLNQQAALAYGMHDAGCTTIEIKVGEKWIQEIG